MSNVYNLEPPTKGKVRAVTSAMMLLLKGHCCTVMQTVLVFTSQGAESRTPTRVLLPCLPQVVLHTNLGDLDIELWPKEAPKVQAEWQGLQVVVQHDRYRALGRWYTRSIGPGEMRRESCVQHIRDPVSGLSVTVMPTRTARQD
jgi:hypothetical protein